MPPTPEEIAREYIDKQLTSCGWIVQSRKEMKLYAGCRVAAGEFYNKGRAAAVIPDNVLFEAERAEPIPLQPAHPVAPADRYFLCPRRQSRRSVL